MNNTQLISIVAPVYNEAGNIEIFYERTKQALDMTGMLWEVIFVNDGSRDESMTLMQALHDRDERIKIINFARNFGHQIAVTAGIDFARGDAVVLIDTDLQDPPELIPELIQKWRDGFDVVYAVREERRGESWFKLFTAKWFYRIIYRITEVDIPLDTGDFRLMDRRVADALRHMREHNRFIRGMTSWIGFKQTGVGYIREERFWGETKYPFKKMIKFAMDAVTSFSFFPLQIMIYLSAFLGTLALLVAIVISVLRLTFGEEFFGGQATTIVLLLFLSAFQLFFQFIIGQYVARTYDESRNRPLYIVADVQGLTSTQSQRFSVTSPYIVANAVGINQGDANRDSQS